MQKPSENCHTLLECIEYGQQLFDENGLFYGHGTDNAWDEAAVLALHALGMEWGKAAEGWDSLKDSVVSAEDQNKVRELFQRRVASRKPAAYLVGEAWFAGLRFAINEDVLVPRSPIAELIGKRFQPWLKQDPTHILDLGTGSGCIGIACAKAFPQAKVVLSDISEQALKVARANITAHDLQNRVSALRSDTFEALDGMEFDLIVSNPPYVDKEDFNSMPAEYLAEPALGLEAGEDGLDIVKRILSGAKKHLKPAGSLVVEVGNSWPALERAQPQLPFVWPEFEFGGHGVFILGRDDLAGGSTT